MRQHIAFGSHWAMGIDHPYSLGVIAGGQFWSCGQCPLDKAASAVAPGDLAAQVRFTSDLIRDQFAPYGIAPADIAKLVVYHAQGGPTGLDEALSAARHVLGDVPLIVPIGVPHFYYDGMMVEIDVHAAVGSRGGRLTADLGDGARMVAVRAGTLAHVLVTVEGGSPATAIETYRSPALTERLRDVLHPLATGPDATLSARVFVARHAEADTIDLESDGNPLLPDPGGMVLADMPAGTMLLADLILAADRSVVRAEARPKPGSDADGILVSAFSTDTYCCLTGRIARPAASLSLPEQTRAIMERFGSLLADRTMSFAHVVKQQAYYVGGASDTDLYDNMRVRNGYYTKPGPASTGLPVHGFLDPVPAIRIELLALRS